MSKQSYKTLGHNGLWKGVENDEGIELSGSIRFKWNYPAPRTIERLGFNRALNKKVASIVLSYANIYTPYREGRLSTDVQVFGAADHATISYRAPYATKQYYLEGSGYIYPNNYRRTTEFHSMASSKWDKLAWKFHKTEITKEVETERLRLCYGRSK